MGFRYENAISGISLCSRTTLAIVKMSLIFVPFCNARCAAAWMTGPSAMGSENGRPSAFARNPPSLRDCANPAAHDGGASSPLQRRDLRDVFVAAAAEVHDHDLLAADRCAVAQQPSEGVRRLERGDDAFAFAQFVKCLQREIVAAVVVLDASDLLQVRVLGAD